MIEGHVEEWWVPVVEGMISQHLSEVQIGDVVIKVSADAGLAIEMAKRQHDLRSTGECQ